MKGYLSAIAALLPTAPCFAAVTVSAVAGNSVSVGASSKSTSVSGLAVGDLVMVTLGMNGAATISSVSDNQSGTWTALIAQSGTPSVRSFYRRIASTPPTSITVSFTDAADNGRITIIKVSGLTNPTLDVNGSYSTGTGASPSIITGMLASANEVVIGVADESSTNNAWSMTTAAGWSQISTQTYGGRQANYSTIVSSRNSVTFNPTLSVSSTYAVNVYSFTGTVAPPPPSCNVGGLTMLGVGC